MPGRRNEPIGRGDPYLRENRSRRTLEGKVLLSAQTLASRRVSGGVAIFRGCSRRKGALINVAANRGSQTNCLIARNRVANVIPIDPG